MDRAYVEQILLNPHNVFNLQPQFHNETVTEIEKL